MAGTAQGTTYSLQWSGGSSDLAVVAAAAERELSRIDALLSNYRPDSVIEQFNSARDLETHALPAEIVSLLVLAKQVHAASAGCFDPTVRPAIRAWGFDGDTPAVPTAAVLAEALAVVGLDKIEIVDALHVRKTVPEVEIDMSSIGQGYTAARLAEVLEEHGSRNYLAEIGGEVVARGAKPDGERWRIGVENPAGAGRQPALTLPSDRAVAVVTSGTYRHYFEADGRRLSHIIDARTGWPVSHGMLAVTVLSDSGSHAAAWGTALLCLGPADAAVAAEREGLAAVWWIATAAEKAELRQSSGLSREWPAALE